MTTSISTLEAGHGVGAVGSSIYADLADGLTYGTLVRPALIGGPASITLSSDAITAINAHLGGSIAFGGSETGSSAPIFNTTLPSPFLTLTAAGTSSVPEPGSLALLAGLTVSGIGFVARKRSRK